MKCRLSVTIVRIEPPAFVNQPAFADKAVVESGARGWSQRAEVDQKEFCPHGKIHSACEDIDRIVIVAENERAIDHYAVIAESPDGGSVVTVAQVPLLVHLNQVVCVERFEA